jgi:hypothetical protein
MASALSAIRSSNFNDANIRHSFLKKNPGFS